MNKTDLWVTVIVISAIVMCLIIGALKELDQLPRLEEKATKLTTQQVTTYHLSIEKLTIRKVGN